MFRTPTPAGRIPAGAQSPLTERIPYAPLSSCRTPAPRRGAAVPAPARCARTGARLPSERGARGPERRRPDDAGRPGRDLRPDTQRRHQTGRVEPRAVCEHPRLRAVQPSGRGLHPRHDDDGHGDLGVRTVRRLLLRAVPAERPAGLPRRLQRPAELRRLPPRGHADGERRRPLPHRDHAPPQRSHLHRPGLGETRRQRGRPHLRRHGGGPRQHDPDVLPLDPRRDLQHLPTTTPPATAATPSTRPGPSARGPPGSSGGGAPTTTTPTTAVADCGPSPPGTPRRAGPTTAPSTASTAGPARTTSR